MKIINVVGARPNFMKIAPIVAEMGKYPNDFQQTLVHTGQHYDDNMAGVFFEELGLPRPDHDLGVGSSSHAKQMAKVMLAFEPLLQELLPDLVVVVGDVNSTLACALVAAKMHVPVAHVEAGLRSLDRAMPEEINRVLTDQIANYLFTTEHDANKNLRQEGIPPARIYFVGNVMIDTLVRLLPQIEDRTILAELGLDGQRPKSSTRSRSSHVARPSAAKPYVLVTLHRPSNVDVPETLREILLALQDIATDLPVIFPVHPRTFQRINEFGLGNLRSSIYDLKFLNPLGYLDFLCLMHHAVLVLTDSGGIQEETTYLGVPCLTLRENTERPVTVRVGTNQLVHSERESLVAGAREILVHGPKQGVVPELWDGKAAERIVAILRNERRR